VLQQRCASLVWRGGRGAQAAGAEAEGARHTGGQRGSRGGAACERSTQGTSSRRGLLGGGSRGKVQDSKSRLIPYWRYSRKAWNN
jgi:hypothetical protein